MTICPSGSGVIPFCGTIAGSGIPSAVHAETPPMSLPEDALCDSGLYSGLLQESSGCKRASRNGLRQTVRGEPITT